MNTAGKKIISVNNFCKIRRRHNFVITGINTNVTPRIQRAAGSIQLLPKKVLKGSFNWISLVLTQPG